MFGSCELVQCTRRLKDVTFAFSVSNPKAETGIRRQMRSSAAANAVVQDQTYAIVKNPGELFTNPLTILIGVRAATAIKFIVATTTIRTTTTIMLCCDFYCYYIATTL